MKKVHFAVIGLGNIAKTHIIALKALPVAKKLPFLPVLDTLVTRNPAANREQALAMGFEHVTNSLDEALARKEIQVVDICTPNAMHYDEAIASAAAGKAVYCEKPLTENYERSNDMVQRIPTGTVSQSALVFRYHPAVMRIRETLRVGLIGEPLQCKVSYLRSGYLDPNRPISWRLQSGLSGGGAITDLGVHVLDLIRHWFGDIADIQGQIRTHVKKRPVESGSDQLTTVNVDDWAHMNITLASGVTGTAEVSRIAWGSDAYRIEIVGTRGSIVCDLEQDTMPVIRLLDGSSPAVPSPSSLELAPDEKMTLGIGVNAHFAALNHFLHRLSGLDRWEGLAPTLEDCLAAESLIHRVLMQSGDPEANRE